MTDRTLVQDAISFRSIPGTVGLEVIHARHVASPISIFNVNYGITVPTTWCADVLYERRRQGAVPGQLFCNVPDTAMRTMQTKAGSFDVLVISAGAFKEYLTEHLPRAKHLDWKATLHKPTRALSRRLSTVFSLTDPDLREGSLATQTAVVLLFASIAEELVQGGTPRQWRAANGVADRLRDWLHDDVSGQVDLQTFADTFGVSRFQVLRAFKHRYGLPPHAYQLCIRVSLAREMLKRGETPADIAAQLGFADQSHFGRHFRRLTGVTPARYAAMSRGRSIAL